MAALATRSAVSGRAVGGLAATCGWPGDEARAAAAAAGLVADGLATWAADGASLHLP